MKIIKEGNLSSTYKQFKCPLCGCVFQCSRFEYREETLFSGSYYVTVCPVCGRRVLYENKEEKKNEDRIKWSLSK